MTKRERRIRSIAAGIRAAHRICRRQALEMARREVEVWEATFSPAGLRAALRKASQ